MVERVVIVGAGVTGLAAAGFLCRRFDCTVLERDREIGGYCRTFYQDGFVWDCSGHFFHFRNPALAEYVHDRLDTDGLIRVRKKSRIRFRGGYVDFPFQHNIHQLPLGDFISCLADLHQAQSQPPPPEGYASFRDMVTGRYGRSLAELFLLPYNEKLYGVPADRLDADAMGRFFPHIEFGELLRNLARNASQPSYNDHFSYHRRGAQAYVEALNSYIPDGVVRRQCGCERIDLDRRVVATADGDIPYDRLIVTAPLPKTLAMAGIAHDRAAFSANRVLVLNLGFDRGSETDDHWVYFPEPEWTFFRVGFYDNIMGQDRMSLYVEISLPAGDDGADTAAHLERALAELRRSGIVGDHRLVSHMAMVLDPAYVHISAASEAAAADATRTLNAKGVFPLGRYGQWTYCSIEDNILSALDLARDWGVETRLRAA